MNAENAPVAANATNSNVQKLVHIDRKILTPTDGVKTTFGKSSKVPKGIIGKPKVFDLKGNLLAEEENLVVLVGREFLAQKLMSMAVGAGNDLVNHEIRYFGIGSGGTLGGATPSTIGPFDTDLNLSVPTKFTAVGGDINSSANNYQYIDQGYLKRIESDGSIAIIQEEHTVNTESGNVTIQKYTSVKFTLKIDIHEPATKPFKFNEAGLYAVEMIGGVPSPSEKILFARFTTLDKYLDTNDGIIIEWHVLV